MGEGLTPSISNRLSQKPAFAEAGRAKVHHLSTLAYRKSQTLR